jgi:hypothetical protein
MKGNCIRIQEVFCTRPLPLWIRALPAVGSLDSSDSNIDSRADGGEEMAVEERGGANRQWEHHRLIRQQINGDGCSRAHVTQLAMHPDP